ncbi:MAG: chloride channel protein [Bacteroidales bacterium]|nr:chloride channel protein [Bacteroidales bacterium]
MNTELNNTAYKAFRPLRRFLGRFSEDHEMMVLAFIVGIVSGLAAVGLKTVIHLIQNLINGNLVGSGWLSNILYLVYPGLGMLLALIFTRYVIKDNIGHGVTKVLLAISKHDSHIRAHNTWSSLFASSVTIGLGGSVGAEAPIVYTGAAIGSNLGSYMGLSYKHVTTLLGCGAAAAVAGIFNAPLAGVLFTLEILLFNISMTTMMPLLIATVSATVVSYILLGTNTPFHCTLSAFNMWNIPFYIALGIFGGLFSLYFTRTTMWLEDKIGDMKNVWLKWILCSVGLGLLIFLFPALYGEGYADLGVLLTGGDIDTTKTSLLGMLCHSKWCVPILFALVLFLKVFSMTFTNAGGGVGGTFGPTLFVGGIAGFVVARTLNLVFEGSGIVVPEQNFVLVGMAALMSGVMQAPMTAIFLIAEISGGYELFLPLIITSAISFGTTRLFEKYSIYTKRIAHAGELLTHDNDKAVLTLLNIRSIVKDKYPRVHENDDFKSLIGIISKDDSAVMAVVGENDSFKGLIDLDHIRKYLFRADLYRSLHVSDVMEQPVAIVYLDEKMSSVMDKFDRTGAWRLPVLDSDGRYKGFVSRSRILTAYRSELKVISSD